MSGSLMNAITSPKGAALLVPAILLVAARSSLANRAVRRRRRPKSPPQRPLRPEPLPQSPRRLLAAPQSTTVPTTEKPVATEKPGSGSAFSATQRKELNSIIKEFLLSNPDVLFDAQAVLDARMEKIQSRAHGGGDEGECRRAVSPRRLACRRQRQAATCRSSSSSTTTAGSAKRPSRDVAKLVDRDKKVRIVLKEFPILSQGLRGGLARRARRQDAGQVLGIPSRDDGEPRPGKRGWLCAWPRSSGSIWPRLKSDMASTEVKKEIDDTRKLATKIGIQGTPHFIVGDRVVAGAPENLPEVLDKHLGEVRKEGCKVC